MTAARSMVLALLVASCSSSSERQVVQLDALRFELPAGWKFSETRARDASTAVWSPADNERKESIAVTRAARPATANADAAALARLLEGAQRSLPKARASTVTPIISSRGLTGARVEVDFKPAGLRGTYHRVHAVFVDGSDLVNVMYTARDPDKSLEAFNLVLATIRHEEG